VQAGVVSDTFRRLPPEKKARLYHAAIRLFGEFGYDGLSVDQLCREAGISKGSFFQYFPSKSHLLEFCVLVFDHSLTLWVDEIRGSETAVLARDRLLHLYRSIVFNSRLYAAEEQFYLFVTRALHHSAVALEGIDLERHFENYVSDIIRRGEQTGEIRGDFNVELTSHLTALIIGALVQRRFAGRDPERREAERYLVSFLFDGIKA
jgi:AcrR family transcriptional regulator